ncbi:Copia protein, partial [Mucuna pruriens]
MHLKTWILCEMLERQLEIREIAYMFMMNEFEMSDLRLLFYFLGIEFEMTRYGMVMHQTKYAKDLLKRLNMQQNNLVRTPVEVGLNLKKETDEEQVDPIHTRPDLNFSMGLVSRFMQESMQSHLLAAKRILRYVQGTVDFGILFPKEEAAAEPKLDKKSTAGYIFFYGGAPISCSFTKEPVVVLSSCETEYIATSKTACQKKNLKKVKLLIDNKSTIDLARHSASHGRSKHMETRFHFLKEQVSNEKLQIEHCRIEIQFIDIFTKALNTLFATPTRTLLGELMNLESSNWTSIIAEGCNSLSAVAVIGLKRSAESSSSRLPSTQLLLPNIRSLIRFLS